MHHSFDDHNSTTIVKTLIKVSQSTVTYRRARFYAPRCRFGCVTPSHVFVLFAILVIFKKLSTIDGVTKYRNISVQRYFRDGVLTSGISLYRASLCVLAGG